MWAASDVNHRLLDETSLYHIPSRRWTGVPRAMRSNRPYSNRQVPHPHAQVPVLACYGTRETASLISNTYDVPFHSRHSAPSDQCEHERPDRRLDILETHTPSAYHLSIIFYRKLGATCWRRGTGSRSRGSESQRHPTEIWRAINPPRYTK